MSPKRHFLNATLCVSIFVVLLVILNMGFSAITMKLDVNEPKIKDCTALKNQQVDVLYLGNSIVQQAINPRVIEEEVGLKGYNLAMGGAGFFEMELLLEHYLKHNKKPDLLVYGIAVNRGPEGKAIRPSVLFSLDSSVRERYFHSRKQNGEDSEWLHLLASRMPVYRYRAAPERLLKYLVQGNQRIPTWVEGHLALSFSYNEPQRCPSHEAGLDEEGLASFIRFCESRDLPLLLIECPNSQPYNDAVTKRSETLARLREVAGSIPFESYNEDVSAYSNASWVALNHFSAQGAVSFSKILAQSLASRHAALKE